MNNSNLSPKNTSSAKTNLNSQSNVRASAIYPEGHELSTLTLPSLAQIHRGIRNFDVSQIWRSDKYEAEREGIRTCMSKTDGLGSDLKTTFAAAYICEPKTNALYLPSESDRTLATYLKAQGFVQEVYHVANFSELASKAVERNRRVLSVDDLGTNRDHVSVNSQASMEFVNGKHNIEALAGRYAPQELKLDLRQITQRNFEDLKVGERKVYIKTCTGEGGGIGVQVASTALEFQNCIKKLDAQFSAMHGDIPIILQAEVKGLNKRFQVFLDPESTNTPVVSLTQQVVAPDGIRYTGSIPLAISAAELNKVGPAIVEFTDRVRNRFPEAAGFLACDYFETAEGKIILFDPALRATGNTPSFMLRLRLKEMGIDVHLSDFKRVNCKAPGLEFSEVQKTLGDLVQWDKILNTRSGILPWGWNQYQGEGTFMVIAPTLNGCDEMTAVLRNRLAKFSNG